MIKILGLTLLLIFIVSCSHQLETPQECISDSDCSKAGCSSQLCVPKEKSSDIITTCEFKEEYSCYQTGNCKCINSKCNWDQETLNCVSNYN